LKGTMFPDSVNRPLKVYPVLPRSISEEWGYYFGIMIFVNLFYPSVGALALKSLRKVIMSVMIPYSSLDLQVCVAYNGHRNPPRGITRASNSWRTYSQSVAVPGGRSPWFFTQVVSWPLTHTIGWTSKD
jgi:hypothetical protein